MSNRLSQDPLVIVADENMPQVREWFGAFGEVRAYPGRTLTAEVVVPADVLLVRSVTRVDAQLLKGGRVRFVGTATIGTDHLDLDYLREAGITAASAPGSNAQSVVDYVLSALAAVDGELEKLLSGQARVGVIGLGNVGGRLLRRLLRMGISAVGYDPFVDAPDLPQQSFEAVLGCDVVCVHTPLTRDGAHPTFHMLDASRLSQLAPGALLLNAGRGAVIDSVALSQVMSQRVDLRVVLDVWEGEPAIDPELLQRVLIGTPHIAGYSLDGKLAGTRMLVEAFCRFVSLQLPLTSAEIEPVAASVPAGAEPVAALRAALLSLYDPRRDDAALRGANSATMPTHFDRLRKGYPVRREVAGCVISNATELSADTRRLLAAAGFGGLGETTADNG